MKDEYRQTWFRCTQQSLPPTFAIITAYNPGGIPLADPQENQLRDQKFIEQLKALDHPFFPILAGNKDFSHRELSYGIDMPLDEAIQLALAFEQDALFWIEENYIHLVECANGSSEAIATWAERQLAEKG